MREGYTDHMFIIYIYICLYYYTAFIIISNMLFQAVIILHGHEHYNFINVQDFGIVSSYAPRLTGMTDIQVMVPVRVPLFLFASVSRLISSVLSFAWPCQQTSCHWVVVGVGVRKNAKFCGKLTVNHTSRSFFFFFFLNFQFGNLPNIYHFPSNIITWERKRQNGPSSTDRRLLQISIE